jgi:hypothetical protein
MPLTLLTATVPAFLATVGCLVGVPTIMLFACSTDVPVVPVVRIAPVDLMTTVAIISGPRSALFVITLIPVVPVVPIVPIVPVVPVVPICYITFTLVANVPVVPDVLIVPFVTSAIVPVAQIVTIAVLAK